MSFLLTDHFPDTTDVQCGGGLMVVLPVALEAAEKTQSNPIAFALVIMMSASISLITTFEPSCILVYGPGRYKFFDFFRTGIVLTLIFFVLIMVLVPLFYPL